MDWKKLANGAFRLHARRLSLLFILPVILLLISHGGADTAVYAQTVCTGEFISVSQPLNDLGSGEYVRLNDGPTGYIGGLYPNGSNVRPPAHDAAGQTIAAGIVPLNTAGQPDANGRIALVSIGMSNTAAEFIEFIRLWQVDDTINPTLAVVNGASPGQTSDVWADPNAAVWQNLEDTLTSGGLSAAQVQVAWIKLAQTGSGDFPAKAESLEADLLQVVHNLKDRFPNVRLAYLSSRTRSYTYWQGLSPEPTAFETGFAVRWLIENQINGDPSLNYDPANGAVVAPYLSWGPYLWIDGLNPRSDGQVWLPEDLVRDCTHPSNSGEMKVANMLMNFFKTDSTTVPWFLADGVLPPTMTPTATTTVTPTPTANSTATSTATPSATPSPSPTVTRPPENNIYLPDVQTDTPTVGKHPPTQKYDKRMNTALMACATIRP